VAALRPAGELEAWRLRLEAWRLLLEAFFFFLFLSRNRIAAAPVFQTILI